MARAVKEATVAELAQRFANSSGAVLTEYRGLTVAQVKELRQALGEDATFAVVKNTLTKLAAKGRYLRKITFSTTMGPGVPVDPAQTRGLTADLEEAAAS